MEAIGEDGSLVLDRLRPIGELESGYTYFAEGDVAIAKITPCFENGKGAVMRGLHGGFGFGTTELIVARPLPKHLDSGYLHRIFTSRPFMQQGEASMYGAGGQKRVPDDFVRDFAIALPPVDEQVVINAFLDRETAKIDALIAEQQRLIELLKEKRQAVISHAVTKGLDPTVRMKDSSVEWLGQVPEHWEVGKIKKYLSTCSGGTPNTSQKSLYYAENGGGLPWVRTTDLTNDKINEVPVFITENNNPIFSSLEELTSFLYESAFFIGNDSGPGHVASALNIPTLTIGQTKDLIDNSFELWTNDFYLTEADIENIAFGINNDLQLRDYLVGFPNEHALQNCLEFVNYLDSQLNAEDTYATKSVLALYEYEIGNKDKAGELANLASNANPTYSMPKLIKRIVLAGWPSEDIGRMRNELHSKVVATIANAYNDEIGQVHNLAE